MTITHLLDEDQGAIMHTSLSRRLLAIDHDTASSLRYIEHGNMEDS